MQPFIIQSLLHHLPSSVTEQDKIDLLLMFDKEMFVRVIFVPVKLLIGWSAFTLLLYYLMLTIVPQRRFSFVYLFAIEVRAEIILVLAKLGMLLRMMIDNQSWSYRFEIPLSCAAFIPVNDYSFFTFLNSINIFTAGYITVISLGISFLYSISKTRAVFIAFLAWGLSSLANVSLIKLLQDQLHLNLF
jgi:hypothetical protein